MGTQSPRQGGTYVEKAATWQNSGWTAVPNALLRDPGLGWAEKGAYGWLASHMATFRLRAQDLADAGPSGRDKAEQLLRNLEVTGWLTRRRERDGQGRLTVCIYTLHPVPVPEDQRTARAGKTRTRRPFCGIKPQVTPDPARPGPGTPGPGRAGSLYKEEKTTRENQPSSSPPPPTASTPKPPSRQEEESRDENDHQAEQLLRELPEPWMLGKRVEAECRPLVSARLKAGWDRQAILRWITDNPGGIRNRQAVVRTRLQDMPETPPRQTRAPHPTTTRNPALQPPEGAVKDPEKIRQLAALARQAVTAKRNGRATADHQVAERQGKADPHPETLKWSGGH